jgi:hypothetical protein
MFPGLEFSTCGILDESDFAMAQLLSNGLLHDELVRLLLVRLSYCNFFFYFEEIICTNGNANTAAITQDLTNLKRGSNRGKLTSTTIYILHFVY